MLVIRDDRFLRHDPGAAHPESPARLRAIHRSLDERPPPGMIVENARPARQADLERVHTPPYLTALAATAGRHALLDPDTPVGPFSYAAAQLAAGAAVQAVEAVAARREAGAFALVRPPGHHAESERAMGFCLLNHVAIAAAFAADELSCRRILILDPDVHHGNGTQWAFWDRADVLYVSSHRFPFYPGTGSIGELGNGPGLGYTVNLPLPAGAGDADLLFVYGQLVAPLVDEFEPDLVLVSAGFDAGRNDPLGGLSVTTPGFAALFSLFAGWAARHCAGRIVLTLEGGYDPEGLAAGVRAALGALAGEPAPIVGGAPGPLVLSMAAQLRSVLSPYWRALH